MTVDRDVLAAHIRMAERWRDIADAESHETECGSCHEPMHAAEVRAGRAVCTVCEQGAT